MEKDGSEVRRDRFGRQQLSSIRKLGARIRPRSLLKHLAHYSIRRRSQFLTVTTTLIQRRALSQRQFPPTAQPS